MRVLIVSCDPLFWMQQPSSHPRFSHPPLAKDDSHLSVSWYTECMCWYSWPNKQKPPIPVFTPSLNPYLSRFPNVIIKDEIYIGGNSVAIFTWETPVLSSGDRNIFNPLSVFELVTFALLFEWRLSFGNLVDLSIVLIWGMIFENYVVSYNFWWKINSSIWQNERTKLFLFSFSKFNLLLILSEIFSFSSDKYLSCLFNYS